MPNAPRSIGVIMDGNRRWARERGLSTLKGHEAGAQKILELTEWASESGIEEIILYTFSTENWNRSPEEVGYLMELLETFLKDKTKDFVASGIQLRVIGDLSRVSTSMQEAMRQAAEQTKDGTKGTLALAFSYGGRAEILSAVNHLIDKGGSVDEERFSAALWSAGLKDPDLILRTGGDMRLSNFLPWQSVYSELFFTDTKWPDLSKEEFQRVLTEFSERERRHGK